MLDIPGLEHIPRHMQPDEAAALQRHARQVWMRNQETGALACEVGSWHGFSTVILAERLNVWAIDLGGDLLHGTLKPDKIGRETWEAFITRMCERNLVPGTVYPICSTSEFLRFLTEPLFDMVFVDADHSYESCLNDLRNTARLAKPECILAVHDVYPGRAMDSGYGVHYAVETFMKEDPRWKSIELVTTMQFLRRVN